MCGEHKVTVIIPAYNEEKSIRTIITCVRRQTYENIELLIVNDGSTDATAEVVQKLIEGDPRCHLITKENGGVSTSRNRGLDCATGEFICFFDADDYIPDESIDNMVRRAVHRNADLVIGTMKISQMNESEETKSSQKLAAKKTISKFNKNLLFSFSPGNKLFRRSIIEENGLRFKEYSMVEDGVFVMSYIECCKKITGCTKLTYVYRKRPFWEGSSLSQTYSLKSVLDSEAAYQEIVQIVDRMIVEDPSDEDDSVDREVDKSEQRKRFKSSVYLRAVTGMIKLFYRHLWIMEEDAYAEMRRIYDQFSSMLLPDDENLLRSMNQDLILDGILLTQEDLLERPLLTVVISDAEKYKKDPQILNLAVESLYRQDFPSFVVMIDKKIKKSLNENLQCRKNIIFMRSAMTAGGFRKKALEACNSNAILFMDDGLLAGPESLIELYRRIEDGADYSIAPRAEHMKIKYAIQDVYQNMAESINSQAFDYSPYKETDGRTWGNKMFRCESLRHLASGFGRIAGIDCVSDLCSKLQQVGYSEKLFVEEHRGS